MPAYEYRALNADGRKQRGVLEGESARQVRGALRQRGQTPLQVVPVAQREARRRGGGRLPAAELALLTRHLATLISAGVPLERALGTVADQSRRPRVTRLILAVRQRVREGHTLAHGLNDYPHAFPALYRATLAAGEQAGYLDQVLERLADYTEARQALQQRTQLALVYPVILTVVALGVTLALLAYVVPEVVNVFADMDETLPGLTRGLITLSDGLRAYGGYALMLLGGLGVALGLVLRRPAPRYHADALLLRLPLVGRLLRGANTARFARTLSILTASSVPVLKALQVAGDVVSNRPMRQAVEDVARQVREGGSLSQALAQSGHFPPLMIHLIESGEASGRLEQMLSRAAEHQERELDSLSRVFLSLFEPLLIVVMGAVVMTIVLAILLPIFELNQLIQ